MEKTNCIICLKSIDPSKYSAYGNFCPSCSVWCTSLSLLNPGPMPTRPFDNKLLDSYYRKKERWNYKLSQYRDKCEIFHAYALKRRNEVQRITTHA